MPPRPNGVLSVAYRSTIAATAMVCYAPAQSNAQIAVDTELLFLVEVSKDITAPTFRSSMQAYGNALTNSSVITEIQRGANGKIAASMVFWSDTDEQTVGLGRMEISDSASAQSFSSQLNALSLPFNKPKKTAIAPAIGYAVPLFGTETGGTENGFSSLTQLIDIAGFKVDDGSKEKNLRGDTLIPAATASALASGVDLINGIAIGDPSGAVESYYKSFVIGGSFQGNTPQVTSAPSLLLLEASLVQSITNNAATGAAASVPEPSSAALFGACSLLLLCRRR